jgi:hypothetical protein
MRKLLATAALAVTLAGSTTALAATYPGGAEGCTAAQKGEKCTYTATRNGGYVANGAFKVTIVRKGVTVMLTDKTHKSTCTNAILAKDKVTIVSTGGQIAAGNPFPSATDAGPSLTGGKPGDYGSCKK